MYSHGDWLGSHVIKLQCNFQFVYDRAFVLLYPFPSLTTNNSSFAILIILLSPGVI